MKKLFLIAILFLSCLNVNAQKNNLSKTDIEEYSNQIRAMVRYVEETFSFIGNPENTPQEKDSIFKESYTKVFKDEILSDLFLQVLEMCVLVKDFLILINGQKSVVKCGNWILLCGKKLKKRGVFYITEGGAVLVEVVKFIAEKNEKN